MDVPLGPGAVPLFSFSSDLSAASGLTVASSGGQLAGGVGSGELPGCLFGFSVLRCCVSVAQGGMRCWGCSWASALDKWPCWVSVLILASGDEGLCLWEGAWVMSITGSLARKRAMFAFMALITL